MRTLSAMAFAAVGLSVVSSAHAGMIMNGNFGLAASLPTRDASKLVYLQTLQTSLSNWTITNGTIDVVPKSYWQMPQGMDYCVDLVGTPNIFSADTKGPGTIQTSVATEVGMTYVLSFQYTFNPESLWGGLDESKLHKRLYVDVFSGGEGASASKTYGKDDVTGFAATKMTNMHWQGDTLTFTAESETTTIQFRGGYEGSLPQGYTMSLLYAGAVVGNIDLNPTSTTPPEGTQVPEPASLAVLGLGSVGLLARKRRR